MPVICVFDTDRDIPLGHYDEKKLKELDSKTSREIIYGFLSSVTFDGIVLPTATSGLDAATTNLRKILYEDILKRIIKKGEKIEFYIKSSKIGKKLIVFKGSPSIQRHINKSSLAMKGIKASMMSIAANITHVSNGSQSLKSVVKQTARGVPFGFLVVAFFDVTKFIANDDSLKSWSDLFVSLGIDFVKTVVATMASVATIAAVGFFLPAIAASGVVAVGGIIVGIFVSFGLESIDANTETTAKAKDYVNSIGW